MVSGLDWASRTAINEQNGIPHGKLNAWLARHPDSKRKGAGRNDTVLVRLSSLNDAIEAGTFYDGEFAAVDEEVDA